MILRVLGRGHTIVFQAASRYAMILSLHLKQGLPRFRQIFLEFWRSLLFLFDRNTIVLRGYSIPHNKRTEVDSWNGVGYKFLL